MSLGRPLRIGLVAPIAKTVPPVGYGGIERVVHEFGEALVRAGHEVVLFARQGSRTSGRLVPIVPPDPSRVVSGMHSGADRAIEVPLVAAIDAYLAETPLDILHDWSILNLFVKAQPDRVPHLASICVPPHAAYRQKNAVAASRAHAALLGPDVPHVPYGVDLNRFETLPRATGPAVHLAKIAPTKAQHRAILAAAWAGIRLDIVGNVEHALYHNTVIRPLVALSRHVRYLGEAAGTGQALKDSVGLVQTPAWFEVLPMVVIEALAHGRPVIGWRSGGLSEMIEHGVNGFSVDSISSLADALAHLGDIRPEACRAYAEEFYSVDRMMADYVRLYQRVLDGDTWEASAR